MYGTIKKSWKTPAIRQYIDVLHVHLQYLSILCAHSPEKRCFYILVDQTVSIYPHVSFKKCMPSPISAYFKTWLDLLVFYNRLLFSRPAHVLVFPHSFRWISPFPRCSIPNSCYHRSGRWLTALYCTLLHIEEIVL